MSLKTRLRFLSGIVLVAAAILAIWTKSTEKDLSWDLKRRAHLGLPGQFMLVPISVELAGTPDNFRKIFEVDGDGGQKLAESDRKIVDTGLKIDYGFAVSYAVLLLLLGVRTWLPGSTCPHWLRLALVILPVLVGSCDVLENVGAQISLHNYAHLSAGVLTWTAAVSWGKWAFGFLELGLLGWSMVGQPDNPRGAGPFLRELVGWILLGVGAVGMIALIFPAMIPGVFMFAFLAMGPLFLMVFVPDQWWCNPPPD